MNLYRFRSMDCLFGERQEFAKQEIYFPSPEQLNDPMEGYKDFIWNGDGIIWKNFLKAFLRTTERLSSLLIIGGDTIDISKKDIQVFLVDDNYPTENYKKIMEEIYQTFFTRPVVQRFINFVARENKIVRRAELRMYFTFLHFIAIETIQKIYEKHRLMPARETQPQMGVVEEVFSNLLSSIDGGLEVMPEIDFPEIISNVMMTGVQQFAEIRTRIEQPDLSRFQNNRTFFFHRFIDAYLDAIESLVYPKWYAACFMKKIDNPIVWSHYGDSHRGICLKFKLGDNADSLSLKGIRGWSSSGAHIGDEKFKLYEIKYVSKYLQIDFFRSLGRLPVPILEKYWYRDDLGNQSNCAENVLSNNKAWRQGYWDSYTELAVSKLDAWEYESEVRVVLNDTFGDAYSLPEERKFKYEFEMLEGIIFGVKTTMEDKVRVVSDVEKKCKSLDKKGKFNFYQAYYDSSGKIKYNLAFHWSPE